MVRTAQKSVRRAEPAWLTMSLIVKPWLAASFRWHIEGVEHLPRQGGAIVASNHVSVLDPLAIGYGLDKVGRRPRFLAKRELFKNSLSRWYFRAIGQIEVRRGTAQAADSLVHAERALKDGEIVVIFPEGKVSTDPSVALLPPKSGVARLALSTGVQVIPCATWGGQWFRPKGKPVSSGGFRKEVFVRFGPPVQLASSAGASDAEVKEAAQAIMGDVGALLESLRAVKPWMIKEERSL